MSISQKSLKVIGVATDISEGWITELQAPHRHYHTLSHVAHIIQAYDGLGESDPALYAAAWLHDIKYDATRGDNEEVSAEIAREHLRGTAIDIPLVVDIIIDSKHHRGGSPIKDLFCDLDLLILGTEWPHYEHYMRAIRKEYAHVPLDDYTKGRANILERFDEKQIFKTEYYRDREKTAHRNLQREIELLRSQPEYFVEVV